ncbi:potassium channel family protein [Methanosarcina hadiensis]|uniref:potassium channel family protein n=1 Tax=Methanosarcina hadiensis TaxID=3078083 RepID=UPI00397790B0
MNLWLLLLGFILVIWILIEALWTALWIDGNSAPFTSRLTTWIWKTFRLVDRSNHHRFLSLSGPLTLFITVVIWVLLLGLGWTLMFQADPGSLVNPKDNTAPDFAGVIWYVAYTMFTVGNGDFSPQGFLWQLISSFVGFTGMSIVTLSITYILQVLSAVVNKRTFAAEVLSIGKSAEEMLLAQWDGKGFGQIELQLNTWSSQLSKLTEQTLSYPILHYYHAARGEKSSAVALAVLDDALSMIACGIRKECQPAPTILLAARQSVRGHLDTLETAFIKPANSIPASPDLSRLREAGIPVVDEKEFNHNINQLQDRRKLLLGMIQNAAWHWPPLKEDGQS